MDTIIMGLDLKQHNKILTKENKIFCAEETVQLLPQLLLRDIWSRRKHP